MLNYPGAQGPQRMKRAYYSESIGAFLDREADSIVGILATQHAYTLELPQTDAWLEQIRILKHAMDPFRSRGTIYFEYSIPRLGRLDSPDASATAHSRLCGSTVTVDVKMDGDVVTDFAHEVKACALGKASSATARLRA